MAQPDEVMVSVGEVPSGAAPQAGSCWPMVGMSSEVSAAAPSWADSVAPSAIAPATRNGRSRRAAELNFTESEPPVRGRTSGANLRGGCRPGQTGPVAQGDRAPPPLLGQGRLLPNRSGPAVGHRPRSDGIWTSGGP